MLATWFKILQTIDYRSKVLQLRDSTIDEEVRNLQSLLDDLQHLRNNWDGIYNEASLVAGEMNISPLLKENRNGARESRASTDTERQSAAVFQFKVNVFLRIIDNVIAEINRRFQRINDINNKFRFLWQYPNLSEMELSKQAAVFAGEYKDDISSEFAEEIQFLKSIHNANLAEPTKPGEMIKPLGPLAILNKLNTLNLQNLFPNVSVALRIFLTLPVGVATAERSFSKLKLIKSYLRSTIGQERLCSLASLSIESDIAEKLDYESVIDAFAEAKARKAFLK